MDTKKATFAPADDHAMTPARVLLVTERPAGGARMVLEAADARILGVVDPHQAIARLDGQVAVDLIVVELDHDGDSALDDLIDRLEADARTGHYAVIAVIAPDLLDLAAFGRATAIETLVSPAPEDLALAYLSANLARAGAAGVADRGAEADAQRLIDLSGEIGRLARRLAALTARTAEIPVEPEALPDNGGPAEPIEARDIRATIRARRIRDQYFAADLFADPAWDMLLDLAAAGKEDGGVPVSSLCIAAAVPPTTALRWIGRLERERLVERRPDPADRRRVFVTLTGDAARRMDQCLGGMQRLLARA